MLTTTASAAFVPLQPGSWLMSILAGFGAVPSNFTVPLRVATVAGSIGVAAGWADCSVAVLLDCSVLSFLLQAVRASRANNARTLTKMVEFFLFMMLLSPM